jgi:hypothetical protein
MAGRRHPRVSQVWRRDDDGEFEFVDANVVREIPATVLVLERLRGLVGPLRTRRRVEVADVVLPAIHFMLSRCTAL